MFDLWMIFSLSLLLFSPDAASYFFIILDVFSFSPSAIFLPLNEEDEKEEEDGAREMRWKMMKNVMKERKKERSDKQTKKQKNKTTRRNKGRGGDEEKQSK